MAKPRGCFRQLVLLLVAIAAALAAAPLLPLSPLKNSVEQKLSRMLGRSVTIDSARLNLIGGPYLTLRGMTAHDDPEFGGGFFLKANEVRAGLDMIRYLRTGQIVIDSITLKSPQISLVKSEKGVWSWTTLGKQTSEQPVASRLVSEDVSQLPVLSNLSSGEDSSSGLKSIQVERASVRVVDHAGSNAAEVLYQNISLTASLTPVAAEDRGGSSQVKGEVVALSEEDGDSDLFKAALPFDLTIDGRGAAELLATGSVGPGPIETKNLSMAKFAISGRIEAERAGPMTGNGHMSASELLIRPINLSEQVAHALKVDQIGDMNPGTLVTRLETDFQISQGSFITSGLSIEQLDGLGDATAEDGSFKLESALTVDYRATITLSADATLRIKSLSVIAGLLVTILETNSRISVPINIKGDVRNPEIQVDVNRIF